MSHCRFAGFVLLLLSPLGLAQIQNESTPSEPLNAAPTNQPALEATSRPAPTENAISPATEAMADTGLDSNAHKLPSVRELLERMSQRQKNLNYQGTFTYQNNTGTESFQLQHWVEGDTENQRLYYLNGPEREAIMRHTTQCQTLAEQLIAGKLDGLADNFTSLDRLYSFSVRGLERVAGRMATVLQVIPRDSFRFGYFFSVDRETGLLLKTLLVDDNQRVVEQFQFVELQTDLAPSDFVAERDATITHRVDADKLSGCNKPLAVAPSQWQLNWLPAGFAFSGQRIVQTDTQMLMYTDGLSTFSIFLDPVEGQLVIEGRAQRGATNFYMQGLTRAGQTYQVTVVGEIPLAVAEKMAQFISRVDATSEQPRG
ncbi:MucB/RseB C-terminal domain-containing protein [Gilvimarinus polysaccharolyticus]|uniref:MucB/RseB C-terminal domain-containing protein n=1 Tax=Gilvimarinus polysaccharolyticus TaxID=863921 RepID=UPI0006730F5F|nr:MucB/RseB C-terminal domain-containing protein [Gilvimarinus polysaccharolyticus]